MTLHSIVLAIAILLSFSTATRAQVGHTAASLEWLVIQSDRIVIARVDTVDRGPSGGLQNPYCWSAVTLKVVEPLKGEAGPPPAFVEHAYEFNRIYEGWRDAGQSYVFFLGKNDEFGRPGDPKYAASRSQRFVLLDVVALGPPVPEEKNFLPRPPGRMTLDLVALSEPSAIIRFVRSAVDYKDDRNRIESHAITLPRDIMQRTGRSGDANALSVPVDRRLQSLAQRLIKAPATFIDDADLTPPKDEADRKNRANWRQSEADLLRAEGVKALCYFHSAENVALLRSILNDPACSVQTHEAPVGPPLIEREYYVRSEAFKILREWDETVREPILREREIKQKE